MPEALGRQMAWLSLAAAFRFSEPRRDPSPPASFPARVAAEEWSTRLRAVLWVWVASTRTMAGLSAIAK
jgi:hypothetical protein